MVSRFHMSVLTAVGLLWAVGCRATPVPDGAVMGAGLLCRGAIQQADMGSGLPPHMLSAIGRVESGRFDSSTGEIHSWPWTVNAEGQGTFFATKAEAIAFTKQLQARGVQSIDVGCMQVNLMHHPDAFRNLEEAFDPVMNARYAVRFLTQLREKTGSWETASAWYHSANPQDGAPYRAKVVSAMADEAKGVPALGIPAGSAPAIKWPVVAMSATGMFQGRGNIIPLPRASHGTILPLSTAMTGGIPGAATAMPAGTATAQLGRGLDAYRRQPIMVSRQRLVADR